MCFCWSCQTMSLHGLLPVPGQATSPSTPTGTILGLVCRVLGGGLAAAALRVMPSEP